MATHSGVLAWRIPGTGEPGGLPSMGSHWVGHNWSDLAAAVEFWDTSSPKDHLALMYPDIRLVFHTSEETQCPLSLRTPLLSSSINSTPFFFFPLRGSVHQWILPDFISVNELILLFVCWILSFTYLIPIKISCETMKRYMGAMSNSMYHFWHSEAIIRIYFK